MLRPLTMALRHRARQRGPNSRQINPKFSMMSRLVITPRIEVPLRPASFCKTRAALRSFERCGGLSLETKKLGLLLSCTAQLSKPIAVVRG